MIIKWWWRIYMGLVFLLIPLTLFYVVMGETDTLLLAKAGLMYPFLVWLGLSQLRKTKANRS